VDAVISLGELLALPGAPQLQEAWLAALAGEHAHLAGQDAEAAACDAIITPVVTGHLDLTVVDQMIDIILAYLDGTEDAAAGSATTDDAGMGGAEPSGIEPDGSTGGVSGTVPGGNDHEAPSSKALSPEALSPQAWQAVRYAIARLAVELVSGPTGLASILRQGLLPAPYNSKPVILDIGYSDQIPGYIRRAVALRARHCEWPGCRKRPAACDVPHLRHRAREVSHLSLIVPFCANSTTMCAFIDGAGDSSCIRTGLPTAHGPRRQVIHSHGPPGINGPPRTSGPPDTRTG